MKHSRFALLAVAGLAGCAYVPEPLSQNHPANPRAAEAPVPARLAFTDTPPGDGAPSASVSDAPAKAASDPVAAPTGKALENINRLPEADRSAAMTQRVCPVGGEPLGSMGMPRKVIGTGHSVFLCCKGCEAEFGKNPEKFLRKAGATTEVKGGGE